MAERVVRHLGGRTVNADSAKVLAAVPVFPMEQAQYIQCSAYMATRADSFPDQPNEINWKVLAVPWSFAMTHNSWGSNTTAAYAPLQDAAAFDDLYKDLIFETGTDGNEWYGGESDATGQTVSDEVPPVDAATDDGDGTTGDEPIISYGPSRLTVAFSREILCGVQTAEGEGKVRWGDFFNTQIGLQGTNSSDGTLLLFGVHRYTVGAETNFGIELNQGDVANPFSQLQQGNIGLIQQRINSDTANAAQWLRTTLFGGDNYIEADTMKSDPAKAYVKLMCGIETPYKRITW